MIDQLSLPLAGSRDLLRLSDQERADLDRLIHHLNISRDWQTARQIHAAIGFADRYLRELASRSEGPIAGGQRGYKLVRHMTSEEYNHFRNWMKSQADKMTARILATDHVFYSRQPVSK